MRIGIDYISALGFGGNASYTRGLVDNLALIDKDNAYFLYTYLHKKIFKKEGATELIKYNNFKYKAAILPYLSSHSYILPILKLLREELFLLNYRLNDLDLFHLTNPLNYYSVLDNFIVTIHDLAPLYDSSFAKKDTILFFQKYLQEIVTKARLIIAVSNFTKQDLLKKFKISEGKIKVIYEGANDIFKPTQNEVVLKKYKLNKKYILSVGQLQPRKNLSTLLKIYSILPDRLKNEYDLVLIGSPRDKDSLDKLRNIIVENKIIDNVKVLGYVDINDLPILYSHAYIFIYLSLLEGFGLPVLESLQCGRPVLVANNSSLPEVAGSAGILVNPKDTDQISFEIRRVLENSNLADNLTKKIPEQIKKFNWQKTARETLAVYIDSSKPRN